MTASTQRYLKLIGLAIGMMAMFVWNLTRFVENLAAVTPHGFHASLFANREAIALVDSLGIMLAALGILGLLAGEAIGLRLSLYVWGWISVLLTGALPAVLGLLMRILYG